MCSYERAERHGSEQSSRARLCIGVGLKGRAVHLVLLGAALGGLTGCDAILGAEVFSGAPDAATDALMQDSSVPEGAPHDASHESADVTTKEAGDSGPSCAISPCSLGEPCARATDCATSYCDDSQCAYASSCGALHLGDSSLPSGAYPIAPGGASFQVYCDMSDQGGGWTLVAKMGSDASPGAFAYSASYWTTSNTLEPLSTDMSHVEAKFQSFNSLPFENVLAMMVARTSAATPNMLLVPLSDATSFLHMMTTAPAPVTNLGVTAWIDLTSPKASLQNACNAEGVNQAPTGDPTTAHIRLGLIANNSGTPGDCSSPDSYVGFGGQYTSGVCTPVSLSAGAMEGAGCGGGPNNIADFGYLFVR